MGKVIIQDVTARDGWQNIETFIPTETKIQLIEKILESGVPSMEYTSYSSPKWIPQLADSAAISEWVNTVGKAKYPNVEFAALIPNVKGAMRAMDAGVDVMNVVMSISEYNNKMNLNMSVADSYEGIKKIFAACKDKAEINVIFTCVFGSYDGEVIDYDRLMRLIDGLLDMGTKNIGIGDSSGLGNPVAIQKVMKRVEEHVPADRIWFHAHDTRGIGLANCYAAYEVGVTKFDTAVCGLGGCPFLPGASGNVSTEDVTRMFNEMGVETGIDMEKMREASLMMYSGVKAPKYNSKMNEVWLIQQAKEKEKEKA